MSLSQQLEKIQVFEEALASEKNASQQLQEAFTLMKGQLDEQSQQLQNYQEVL